MKIFMKLRRRIAMWFFVHQIGKMYDAYKNLTQQTEKVSFLMEKFGTEWRKAMDEKQ